MATRTDNPQVGTVKRAATEPSLLIFMIPYDETVKLKSPKIPIFAGNLNRNSAIGNFSIFVFSDLSCNRFVISCQETFLAMKSQVINSLYHFETCFLFYLHSDVVCGCSTNTKNETLKSHLLWMVKKPNLSSFSIYQNNTQCKTVP